tara:strand:- start:361 stop:618 length:258 start_codon:yes stop_codon:yes gene_type:complete
MHYVRVMISQKTSSEGAQWVTHVYREGELAEMYSRIRDWESRNTPFEYQFSDSVATLKWSLESELEVEEEMAKEADNYDPEGEWF